METLYRQYGVATNVNFELYEIDGIDLKVDAASATGDIKIMKDNGAEATLNADAFVDEGQGYSLAPTAAEMAAARIVIYIVDQSTKVWLDRVIRIETYGHPSAAHPTWGSLEGSVILETTADAADANTVTITTDGVATTGYYDGCLIFPISGTGGGQRPVYAAAAPDGTTYNSGTKVITLSTAFPTTLSTDSVIRIVKTYQGTVTIPTNFPSLGIESDGDITKVNELHGHTVQTGDSFARLGAPAGASVSADLLVIDNFVDGIETAVVTNAAGADVAADIIALDAIADAIKVVTDKFAFGVANQVDANVTSVNETGISGDGGTGTEFQGA